jgi:Prenyltransferase and squalene oxidase repeat
MNPLSRMRGSDRITTAQRLWRALAFAPSLVWLSLGSVWARQDPVPGKPKASAEEGFAEGRTGTVPEGADRLVTSEAGLAIETGLSWLSGQQNADGSFGSGAYRGNIAVTSLAGLAFMASGSSPGRGPYGVVIDRTLRFVLDNTSHAGLIAVPNTESQGPMYSHGWGTLFLAEAYGMTRQPEIREKLTNAVRLIIDTQNNEGGWRYQPVRHDADISVTICQINALRAARNAGLYVPKETVDACIRYVKQSQNPDGGFRYMVQGGASAFPRSAAGVVALYSAAVYNSDEIDRGIAYLKLFPPGGGNLQGYSHYFYAQYYAAQAMWIRGGEDWLAWYPLIRDELIRRQLPRGSWQDSVCLEYGTAMALIVLQMPNDYLPIFQR